MIESMEFKVKPLEDIVKVVNCTYEANTEGESVFYFCSCQKDQFYPICESCAKSCHNSHNPVIKIIKDLVCMCGKSKHQVCNSEENYPETPSMCLYSVFHPKATHAGIYILPETELKVCSICKETCYSDIDVNQCYKTTNKSSVCECDKHYELNIINIYEDIKTNKLFSKHFVNFNFNLFLNDSLARDKVILPFKKEIEDFHLKPSEDRALSFFTNYFIHNAFMIYRRIKRKSFNKFSCDKDVYTSNGKFTSSMMDLLRTPGNPTEHRNLYSYCKLRYAEFLFNLLVKQQLPFTFNFYTITNMNIYQRKEILQLYKRTELIDNYVDCLLTVTEELIVLDELESISNFKRSILSNLIKIFCSLVKYNLISEANKKKLLLTVRNAFEFKFGKSREESKYTEDNLLHYYTVKLTFYCLLYKNDEAILSDGKVDYVFLPNSSNDLLCSVFIRSITNLRSVKKRNKYSEYIKKNFELLALNSHTEKNFYFKNITMMAAHQKKSPDSSNKADVTFAIEKFNKIMDESINEYLLHESNFEDFYSRSCEAINDLGSGLFRFLDETDLLNDVDNKPKYGRNLTMIQECMKDLNISYTMDKFYYIISEYIQFHQTFNDINTHIDKEPLEVLMRILLIMIEDNYENLVLFTNIGAENISNVYGTSAKYGIFLVKVTRELFRKGKKFDNYMFYYRLMNNIFEIKFSNEIIPYMFLCVAKFCKYIKPSTPELFDLTKVFISSFLKKVPRTPLSKTPSEILSSYLEMINNIMLTDLFFFNIIKHEDLLYDQEEILEVLDNVHEIDLDPLVISQLFQYAFKFYMNFSITNSREDTYNMIELLFTSFKDVKKPHFLMRDANFGIVHLTNHDLLTREEPMIKLEEEKVSNHLDHLRRFKNTLITQAMEYFDQFITKAKSDHVISYYKRNIMCPVFSYVSQFMLYEKEITGKDSLVLYELIGKFIDKTLIFYNMKKDVQEDPDINLMINLHLLNRISINYKNLIKYFEIENIIDVYRSIFKQILKAKSKDKVEQSPLKLKYKDKFKSLFGANLSFFKSLQDENEFKQIFDHVYSKIWDNLDFNNVKDEEMVKNYFSNMKTTFNPRNIQYIEILNNFFYHNSAKFQLWIDYYLTPDNVQIKNNIFDITTLFIFSNLVNQCRQLYQLDMENHFSLSYKLCYSSISLLNYMCENDNKKFQDYLFDFILKDQIENFTPLKIELIPSVNSFKSGSFTRTSSRAIGLINMTYNRANRNNQSDSSHVMLKKFEPVYILKNFQVSEMLPFEDKLEAMEHERLCQNKFSFLNFLFIQMRIIVKNLHFDNEYYLLYHNREIKNYKALMSLFEQTFCLLIGMIKGITKTNYFKKFFQKYQKINFEETYKEHSDYFLFLKFASNIKNLVFTENILEASSIKVKKSIFVIMNQIITREMEDDDLIHLFTSLFPIDDLIGTVSKFLRAIYIKHVLSIDYTKAEFLQHYQRIELNQTCLDQLNREYLYNNNIFQDELFKLSSEIFLFITILAQMHKDPKAMEVFDLINSSFIPVKLNYSIAPQGNKKTKVHHQGGTIKKHKKEFSMVKKIKKIHVNNSINNSIATCKFFSNIVKRCEFYLPQRGKGKLSEVYFILNKDTFLISDQSVNKFEDNVDRSSPNQKLNDLVREIPNFLNEIKYKKELLRESPKSKWMIDVNYTKVDRVNFLIGCFIILILMIDLKEDFPSRAFFNVLRVISVMQIIINVVYFFIFYKSKYKYYKMLKNDHSLTSKIFDCFLWTEDTYIMFTVVVVGIVALISPYLNFLYALQLFSIIRFVSIIKQLALAFKSKFGQFLSMISFLAILINFYAAFGFYFMNSEFNITVEDGEENICHNMLSCFAFYFNYGVRSGGGVGDVLTPKAMSEGAMYWLRYFADLIFYITCILLLLNMINGIIISAFGALRDENEQKNEDREGKCFMCSIPKVEFEKQKVQFEAHKQNSHNLTVYIRYIVGLYFINKRDLSEEELYILDCIENRQIKFFPIGRACELEEAYDVGADE